MPYHFCPGTYPTGIDLIFHEQTNSSLAPPHDGRACGHRAHFRQEVRFGHRSGMTFKFLSACPGGHGATAQNLTEKEEIIQVLPFHH